MDSPQQKNLNLARKLRPQTFDTIIGQEIPVRMLKNGLYLKKFFPVYLFAGQRGCGKTSTARVFAAAINCHNLELFQQKPTEYPVPCLTCASCQTMLRSQHPDFIEIDAASNTGVDNVRQIIETASYVPLSGRKKIYLIDEAHMLSKAAFNAFLKILEEPPVTVHFILATTELQKVPETVLSRCFQLTFNAINHESLKTYLIQVCQAENVRIDSEALDVLIDETDGSARDALNLLEQVRFSTDHVTIDAILSILGKVSTNVMVTLFEHIIDNKPQQVLKHLHSIDFKSLTPVSIWNMVIEFCRALLWVKFGVKDLPNAYKNTLERLEILAQRCPLHRLHALMQLLWSQEQIFSQTDKKHAFLELIFLQLCHQSDHGDLKQLNTKTSHVPPSSAQVPSKPTTPAKSALPQQTTPATQSPKPQLAPAPQPLVQEISLQPKTVEKSELWQTFVQKFGQSTEDFMLHSILVQALFLGINQAGMISLQLNNNSKFLREKITDSSDQYLALLKNYFETFSKFEFMQGPHNTASQGPQLPSQRSQQAAPSSAPSLSPLPPRQIPQKSSYNSGFGSKTRTNEQLVDIRDKEKWPLANLIISHFPGKIVKKIKALS